MSDEGQADLPEQPSTDLSRRSFVGRLGGLAMLAGLLGSYGTFFSYALRFLYPARPLRRSWLFAAYADQLKSGETLPYSTPSGEQVTIARQGEGLAESDFIALSSTCPHLGCQVRWEAHNRRFFCPCHNGVFTPQGEGIEGPPKGQQLKHYPLRIERGLIYIEVPVEGLGVETDNV